MTRRDLARLKRAVDRAPHGRKRLNWARLYQARHDELRRNVEAAEAKARAA